MFAGFNLDLTNITNTYGDKIINFSMYKKQGEDHLNSQKDYYKKRLEEYVINGTSNDIVDGTKLQDDWFPQVEVDVFISHSHKDLEIAQCFAGWLYANFKLKCFIDANVWGYADDLLEQINSVYSNKRTDKDGGSLYNHNACNVASKHVSVMLTIALQKMIDKAETTFVLNTANSIQKYAQVYSNSTYSPWIYTEIVCTEIVRKKPLSEYRKVPLYKFASESTEISSRSGYQAAYTISLEHLINIDPSILIKWSSMLKEWAVNRNAEYPLDILYILTGKEKSKKLEELYKNYPQILLG